MNESTSAFTVFRPPTSVGVTFGAAATAVIAAAGLGLIYRGLTMDVELWQIVPFVGGTLLLCLAALYGYWTWSCASMSYIIDRNALSIRWGGVRQVVPLANIDRLIRGSEGETPRIDGISELWPGHKVGTAYAEEIGTILFYSTHRTPTEVLYILTPDVTYAISVPDPLAFAQTIQTNQARGPLFEQRQTVHRWGIAAQSFWTDYYARLLAAALIGSFLLVLGYVLQTFPDLTQQVPLRFPALGGIVRVSDKSELLDIPRSAAGFLAVNLVLAIFLHSWERMVAYVLLMAGIAIQLMLLVAAIVAVA